VTVAAPAHDRGAVLVATIFDAFQRIYRFRTADLFRIASGGTGVMPAGSISRDLVGRLARETNQIAEHLLHICIRALDYCPPVDITFGDYFRALITADADIAPEDETGYRVALIEAFRARGIFPAQLRTLSVESLRWERPDFTEREQAGLRFVADKLEEHLARLVETRDREELFNRSQAAQAMLHGLLVGKAPAYDPKDWEAFLNRLGLTSRPVSELFGADSAQLRFDTGGVAADAYVPPIQVHTVRPTFRAGREGRQIQQMLITLIQTVRVNLAEEGEPDNLITSRGGCSLILSLGSLASADYVVRKSIKSYWRFRDQVEYLTGGGEVQPELNVYSDTRGQHIDFSLLHRH